jgi:hypothetical protein
MFVRCCKAGSETIQSAKSEMQILAIVNTEESIRLTMYMRISLIMTMEVW